MGRFLPRQMEGVLLGPQGDQLLSAPDLDECAFPGVCSSGICTNTAGSFSCRDCDQGYRPSPSGHTCEGESPCRGGEHRRDSGFRETNPSPSEKKVARTQWGLFPDQGPSTYLGWWASWVHLFSPLGQ